MYSIKQRGFALIPLIIAMVLMSALGVGIYTLTTSSTLGELLAGKDYNAYQLAKAGLRYAALQDSSTFTGGTFCMSGGCFQIAIDNTDPTVTRYTSKGYVNQGTFLAANRQLAYNMPKSSGGTGTGTINFDNQIGDIPQPMVGWGMNKSGAVTVDTTNKQILLGDGTAATTDAFGSVVYGGDSYLGNCAAGGICDFGAGIHAYFEFKFFPEDSSANSTLSADGFTFAIFNGTNNLVTATGGAPPDVASLGELVGYAGPGTHVGTEGPGWQPPKLGIEFDSYPNTNSNSITVPGSRRDPTPFRDHMALLLWGENNAAPYRIDADIANAVGLRCAPNDEFIRSLYRSVLGRNAELGGVQGWTSGLNGGANNTTTTQNTARSSLYGSFFGLSTTSPNGDPAAEYTLKNRTDVQYVNDVSRAVLGAAAPTVPAGTCPAGQFYAEYFNNLTLTGTAVSGGCVNAPINYTWGTGGPGIQGIGTNHYSVRWTGNFLLAGNTTFTSKTNDGVRVRVDGNLITNEWNDHNSTQTYTDSVTLTAGYHPVVMEYYEHDGSSVAGLSWTTPSRLSFLNAVLASAEYTNNVTSCGVYSATAPIGTYNCSGVSRVSTALDCSGLPLSLYNRDTLDDNVHSEGGTESSFTAIPLSPQNAGGVGTGYYEVPNRTCASGSGTCWGFEDGYTHKFRIEVLRDTTSHTCSRDYSGASPPSSSVGNCYNYTVKAWLDCDGGNPTGCTATQLANMKNVKVAFTEPAQITRTIELTQAMHTKFDKMIFGWTGSSGQPVSGLGQKVTLSNFELFFRTPQACPVVTSITPASLPAGTVGAAYSQTLAAAPTSAKTYTWALASGALPSGLGLSSVGVISGSPTAAGTSNFVVRTTNTCGGTLTKAYSIVVPPTVASISPNTHSRNGTLFNVTITGTGFKSGASVTQSGTSGGTFTISNVQYVNATTITASFTISSGVPTGTRTIRVTNSDTLYGELVNGFTVTEYSCSGVSPTTSGSTTIYTYTSTPATPFTCTEDVTAEILVVGGGGGAGQGESNSGRNGGGGGAGGLIYDGSKQLTATTYAVAVGAGGAGSGSTGNRGFNGGDSQFGTLIAVGGGGGGSSSSSSATIRGGANGGSGGGAGRRGTNYGTGGSTTQTGGFGFNGATSTSSGAGGGGGASVAGGVTGGGAGRAYWGTTYATGGSAQSNAGNGTSNTGNGGNAAANSNNTHGGDGGTGVVIIRVTPPLTPPSCTGGTITSAGGKTIHTFTSGGTLTCSVAGAAEVLVVAGGGGGGKFGGGGGAGGVVYNASLGLTAQAYTVTVGNGGNGSSTDAVNGTNGSNSVFSTITATGGGGGGSRQGGPPFAGRPGNSGGSGGGGSPGDATGGTLGAGGSASPAGQGNNGGTEASYGWGGSGGGGAGAAGTGGTGNAAGAGGNGITSGISGINTNYAGGGGGCTYTGDPAGTIGAGGSGGGGAGGKAASGVSGTANTGGGGGGSDVGYTGGNGGSGIVIIRY